MKIRKKVKFPSRNQPFHPQTLFGMNYEKKLQNLLMSKTESDSAEAINFFTAAYLFGIKNTEHGLRQMLYLVWATAKEKREPVREAFKHVLWKTDQQGR